MSIMKNMLDPNAKRGAIVKALAFGSRRPNLPECFKSVASSLLETLFFTAEESKTSLAFDTNAKSVISKCFDSLRSPVFLDQLPNPIFLNSLDKQVYTNYMS